MSTIRAQLLRVDTSAVDICNLEVTHAEEVSDMKAEIEQLKGENRSLKQAANSHVCTTSDLPNEDDTDYLELRLSASSTQEVVCQLQDKAKGLELQLREERESWAAYAAAEVELATMKKQWSTMESLLEESHSAILGMIRPIFAKE